MSAVTVSPKFQVVIPLSVRKALGLVPGAKLHVLQFENRIKLIPLRSAQSLLGSLPGLETTVPRDADRL